MSAGPGLRQNRDWRLLWIGQSISLVGDFVFYTTVSLWIATIIAKNLPWAPAAVSGALIAVAVPTLIVGPLAGVYVDRWNRRRTMLVADAARCVLIAGLLVVPALRHHSPVWVQLAIIYLVMALSAGFAQFFDPSRMAVLGAIVAPEDMPTASGRMIATQGIAQLAGPPIAAPLLFTSGVQWALIIDAASFAASFGCVRAIRMPAEQTAAAETPSRFWAEFREGLRFFGRNQVLVAITVGVVIALLGIGIFNTLGVFFIPRNLHVSPSWLGAMLASFGAGSIVGGLAAGAVTRRIVPTRAFWLCLIIGGVLVIGYSRTTAIAAAIAVSVVLGINFGVLNAVTEPIVLSVTPSRMLGRVMAVIGPLMQLATVLSAVLAGALTSTVLRNFHASVGGQHFGPYDTLIAAGGALFIAAGLGAARALRPHPTPAAEEEPVQASEPA